MARKNFIAIDPGKTGAIVRLTQEEFSFRKMPLTPSNEVDFDAVQSILKSAGSNFHVLLERAIPFAMGVKPAFEYGRDYKTLELAVKLSGLSVTYVEPSKWTKVMHAGISSDLKPKVKSAIAVERLFPSLIDAIPKGKKNGKLDEGVVDALLLAGYGVREL